MAGPELTPGEVIAGYTVVAAIGAGGMGTVYLARHPRLPRNQAIKVLAPGLSAEPRFRDRFTREAELAATLDHPNIVAVQDAGVDGERMWIAMQYVAGSDAQALVKGNGPLRADLAVGIIAQAAAGLDYAHDHGMLHRDVKPANLLLGGEPDSQTLRVLVADFGVARILSESTTLTGAGVMVGTLAYAAPELFDDKPLTPAVDVYALGCTLYELLTGSVVFPQTSQMAMMRAHATEPPPPVTRTRPDLPPAIDAVIMRALAKEPAGRYRTCGAFADAARGALGQRTGGGKGGATGKIESTGRVRADEPRGSWLDPGGAPIATAAQQAPTLVGPHTPWRTPPGHPGLGPGSPGGMDSAPAPSRPGGGRHRKAIVGAAIAAVLAVVAVGVSVALMRGQDDPSPTRSPNPSGAPPSPVSGTRPADMRGTWRGTVTGDQDGFDVVATISAVAPVRAQVEYPDLGCAGTWTEVGGNSETVTLLETIERGNCVTSHVELAARDDGTLTYRSRYYSDSQKRTFTITATLRRE